MIKKNKKNNLIKWSSIFAILTFLGLYFWSKQSLIGSSFENHENVENLFLLGTSFLTIALIINVFRFYLFRIEENTNNNKFENKLTNFFNSFQLIKPSPFIYSLLLTLKITGYYISYLVYILMIASTTTNGYYHGFIESSNLIEIVDNYKIILGSVIVYDIFLMFFVKKVKKSNVLFEIVIHSVGLGFILNYLLKIDVSSLIIYAIVGSCYAFALYDKEKEVLDNLSILARKLIVPFLIFQTLTGIFIYDTAIKNKFTTINETTVKVGNKEIITYNGIPHHPDNGKAEFILEYYSSHNQHNFNLLGKAFYNYGKIEKNKILDLFVKLETNRLNVYKENKTEFETALKTKRMLLNDYIRLKIIKIFFETAPLDYQEGFVKLLKENKYQEASDWLIAGVKEKNYSILEPQLEVLKILAYHDKINIDFSQIKNEKKRIYIEKEIKKSISERNTEIDKENFEHIEKALSWFS